MNAANLKVDKIGQSVLSFIRNHKRTIYEIVSVVAFFVLIGVSVSKCTYYKDVNERNIIAFTDSVNYYKGKYGNEVASKSLIEGDYKNLKNINDSLYRLVENMKVKKPDVVIGGTTIIDNGKHDTIWIPNYSELQSKSMYRKFDFSDKYRTLLGNVNYSNDTLGLSIEEDKVNFNYALAIKDHKVYMTSDNPYVKFSSITGLEMPKEKKVKKFGIGPSIFYGYGKNGWNYGIGIGLQYSIINF